MSIQKTPMSKVSKQHYDLPGFYGSNPFGSDSESGLNSKPARASSAPPIGKANSESPGFSYNEEEGSGTSSSFSYMGYSVAKKKYKDDFRESGGFENQSVQELEGYAVYKAEETTQKVNGCLKIAEEIREDATRTLVNLNQQGEQITRAHLTAANIEPDLSRGEKLLGNLGGIFSRTWKPKKTRRIKGPVLIGDDAFLKRGSQMEQRQKIGSTSPRSRTNPRQFPQEPTSALEKVEVEKAKQDDALTDLSNLVGQLKEMAVDMGYEIERQNTSLDHLHDDVDVLNIRVKGATQRTRHLLGK